MAILWNSTLETGIPQIDAQHKEIFRQADILLDKTKSDRIPETIKFLGDYVVKHFSDEQMAHTKVKYPKALSHKALHTKFISVFKDMRRQYDSSGDKLSVVLNINKAVVGWLKDHIMTHDKEFSKYYKEHGGK